MNHSPTPGTDRTSAKADLPEAATAPAEQPADRGAIPASAVAPQATDGQRPVDPAWDSAEYRALVAAGLRAPNQRQFTLNSDYAWELFRPEPSLLPQIHLFRHNPIERDES